MIRTNPLFLRFCRSQLRFRKAIFWYLLTFITTAFLVTVIYVPQTVRGGDPETAARAALFPLLIVQGVILIFMATGSIASGITREKVDKVLDYQRLTPLPVRQKITGYLFGLPVREYTMFAITLPFTAFILFVGNIPSGAWGPYYLIFFSASLLYHFTGMVAGMISRKWRWSARITQGLIILLYFVLPQLSHLGLVFMEFLTVRPVFAEKILPLIGENPEFQVEGIGLMAGKSVPFFSLMISGTLFSLIIQLLLITLFAWITARKWRSDAVPAVSKPMAVLTLGTFSLICLANIWPNLTRSSHALDIFQSGGDLPQQLAISAIPLILALVTTALALALLSSALPDPIQYRHGQIRASRQGRDRLSPLEDAASGYLLLILFALIQVPLLIIAFSTLSQAGYFEGLESSPWKGLYLILSTLLVLAYFQGLKEAFGGGQLGLIALLHGLVPILIGILVVAIDNSRADLTLLLAALSPLSLQPLSAALLIPPESFDEHLATVHRSLGLGFLSLAAITTFLHVRLLRSRKRSNG